MATITFFAPAERQWTSRERNLLNALCRTLGNESYFGWCDVMMSSAGDGPRAEFCDHFGCVVRLTRSSRRYEITCMRTDVCSRTTKLERALELVRVHLRAHTDPDRRCIDTLASWKTAWAERDASAYCDTLERRKITARGSGGRLS